MTFREALTQRMGNWVWLACRNPACGRALPVALAPFAIRWGLDADLALLRRRSRCAACGWIGATMTTPSWGGMDVGWVTFPAARMPPAS
jgi:hypothetical protein